MTSLSVRLISIYFSISKTMDKLKSFAILPISGKFLSENMWQKYSSVILAVEEFEIWFGFKNVILYSIIQYWSQSFFHCSVCSGSRIHRLFLWRGIRPPYYEFPGYDSKQPDSEVSVILELWEMWSTSSLPSLLGPIWLRMVAPDRAISMGQRELNYVFMLNWIVWNRTLLTFNFV